MLNRRKYAAWIFSKFKSPGALLVELAVLSDLLDSLPRVGFLVVRHLLDPIMNLRRLLRGDFSCINLYQLVLVIAQLALREAVVPFGGCELRRKSQLFLFRNLEVV
jgi:hypothetical protein